MNSVAFLHIHNIQIYQWAKRQGIDEADNVDYPVTKAYVKVSLILDSMWTIGCCNRRMGKIGRREDLVMARQLLQSSESRTAVLSTDKQLVTNRWFMLGAQGSKCGSYKVPKQKSYCGTSHSSLLCMGLRNTWPVFQGVALASEFSNQSDLICVMCWNNKSNPWWILMPPYRTRIFC